MCVASTPHIDPNTDSSTQKQPAVIRNPILDGMLGNIAALRGGRNALRIDLLNPLAIPGGGGGTFSSGGVGGDGSGTSSGSSSGGSGGTSISTSGGKATRTGGTRSGSFNTSFQ